LLNALRLSPRDPITPAILGLVTASYYLEHDYPRAAETGQRAVSRFPNHPTVYRYLAASLGQLGRTDEAEEVLQKAIQVSRQYFELSVSSRPPWNRPEDYEHMLDGLRKAGWQG
jgi:adenylate cyclase